MGGGGGCGCSGCGDFPKGFVDSKNEISLELPKDAKGKIDFNKLESSLSDVLSSNPETDFVKLAVSKNRDRLKIYDYFQSSLTYEAQYMGGGNSIRISADI